jgi:hypothetical protein
MNNAKQVEVTGKAEWGLNEIKKKRQGGQIEKWMIRDNKNRENGIVSID